MLNWIFWTIVKLIAYRIIAYIVINYALVLFERKYSYQYSV